MIFSSIFIYNCFKIDLIFRGCCIFCNLEFEGVRFRVALSVECSVFSGGAGKSFLFFYYIFFIHFIFPFLEKLARAHFPNGGKINLAFSLSCEIALSREPIAQRELYFPSLFYIFISH